MVQPDAESGPKRDSANVAVGDGSLKLDGVDDRLVIRPSNRLSSLSGRTKALTVSAWIKPASGGSTNNRGIIGALEHGSDKQANQLFMLQLVGNDLRGVVYTDAGFFVASGNAPIEMNGPEFIHVAYTWDGTQLIRYINGQAVQDDIDNPKYTTGAKVLRWRNGADEISIGASQPKGNAFFKGNIDDLAVFDHALNAEEIKGLADKSLTPMTVPDPDAEVTETDADSVSVPEPE
ncbi:MAG: LamG domain-containing protein [Planctomycetota bacterium]